MKDGVIMLKVYAQLRGSTTVGRGRSAVTRNRDGRARANSRRETRNYSMARSTQSQIVRGSNRLRNRIQG